MKPYHSFVIASLLALSAGATAHAAADLRVTLTGPASADVLSSQTYVATITNIGNVQAKTDQLGIYIANGVTLLSVTPTPYVSCMSNSAGSACTWGAINPGQSATAVFVARMPAAALATTISVRVTSKTAEATKTNNNAAIVVAVVNPGPPALSFTAPRAANVAMCAGGSPIASFNSCGPGSIQNLGLTLNADQTITLAFDPTSSFYTGTWSQTGPSNLKITVREVGTGALVVEYPGVAVTNTCAEGLTTYPTAWYGAFRACLQ